MDFNQFWSNFTSPGKCHVVSRVPHGTSVDHFRDDTYFLISPFRCVCYAYLDVSTRRRGARIDNKYDEGYFLFEFFPRSPTKEAFRHRRLHGNLVGKKYRSMYFWVNWYFLAKLASPKKARNAFYKAISRLFRFERCWAGIVVKTRCVSYRMECWHYGASQGIQEIWLIWP